ncbi:tetratricopeptide repeat protein [Flavobacterium sp.]|uniref:tetratricopeptide repeat protein n=1 Tax=Flavobacterium sp. TaxID=239 RepID=UPI0025BBCE46|nr:tetratricopeptide repeat protein [Flavobacterium sp.]
MRFLIFALLFSLISVGQSSFDVAVSYFDAKKLNEAKSLFEVYLKSNPNDLKAIEYLGDIAGQQKKWDEAVSYYSKLKTKIPTNADYQYKYGGALGMKAKSVNKMKALGMIDDIEQAFLTAAKLDKKHINTRWALVMLYLELPAIIGGSETKAKKYADELLLISRVDGYLAHGYIEVYFKRYKKAETLYIAAHRVGESKTTFEKLYDLYLNKLKDKPKAEELKNNFNK